MRILIQFIVLALLTLQSSHIFGQSRSKIVIGYASMSSVATTLWVAQERGFFAKNISTFKQFLSPVRQLWSRP